MKRVKPVSQTPDPEYPSAEEAGVNRRGFLKVLVGTGAAAAGAVVLGGDEAHARGIIARPRYRVAIDLKPPVKYAGCKSAVVQIIARSYSHQMDVFLKNAKERKSIVAVIRAELRKYKCADLTGNGRYRIQGAVGKALAAHYKRRTGNNAGTPWITLKLKKTS